MKDILLESIDLILALIIFSKIIPFTNITYIFVNIPSYNPKIWENVECGRSQARTFSKLLEPSFLIEINQLFNTLFAHSPSN